MQILHPQTPITGKNRNRTIGRSLTGASRANAPGTIPIQDFEPSIDEAIQRGLTLEQATIPAGTVIAVDAASFVASLGAAEVETGIEATLHEESGRGHAVCCRYRVPTEHRSRHRPRGAVFPGLSMTALA